MYNIIHAHWCLGSNFGDALNQYMIEILSGKKCVFSNSDSDTLKHVCIGSILNWDIHNAVIWGSGIANKNDYIPNKDIRLVRGHISKNQAIQCGNNCHDIPVGDPALILPLIYNPEVSITHDLAIFPHYVDIETAYQMFGDSIKIIDPLMPIETVIKEIKSCKQILSSSLHGLIVSDAYGVKTKWISITDRIGGDGTKYLDYYTSIGITTEFSVQLNVNTIHEIVCTLKSIPPDTQRGIIMSCPFMDDIKKNYFISKLQ